MDMNMDVKDLIAKLKSKGKSDGRTGGGISAFFEKNPKMKIIIPVIMLAISVLVAVLIIFSTGKFEVGDVPKEDTQQSAGEIQVENLPQDRREVSEDLDGIEDVSIFNDAALAHPKITAIIYNEEGYYTATVVTDNAHYPNLSIGQYVPGSEWLVENVTADKVVFSCNGQIVTVNY